MSETLTLENKSNTDYILEYIAGEKKKFIFLFGGDKRQITNKPGEAGLRISSSSYGLKDFSFFGVFPGKMVIQNSENEDGYDFIYDLNLSKRINLKFNNRDYKLIKKELAKHAYNVISLDKGGSEQKKTLDKAAYRKNLIYLFNSQSNKIRARVSSDSIHSSASAYIDIKPGEIAKWAKDESEASKTFQIQIDTNDKEENEEIYLVRCGYLYEYNDLNFLTYLRDYCVPISRDDFCETLSETLVESATKFEKTEYAVLPVLSLKKVFSRELVLKYASLSEDNIIIHNKSQSDEFVNIRIRVRNLGSDDFFTVKSNQKRLWRRTPGKYIAEVLDSHYRSARFYLETGNTYEFKGNGSMHNLTHNSAAERLGPKEVFNHITYITVFDQILGGFDQVDIMFENNSKFNVKNKDFPVPYYNDLLPDYVPGNKFVDKYFSPNENQILAKSNLTGEYVKPHFPHLPPEYTQIGKCSWLRPEDIFRGKPFKLFQDAIECSDVNQGSLGNCYLISIIAALSERHDLIKKIFKTKQINKDGFYEIYFYEQDGTKRIMFLDDYFPYVDLTRTGKQDFIGTVPNGEEIWVMLLEKAYAKYEGGWVNLEGGTITSELKFFTGSNCKELNLTTASAWSEILNACRRDNLVCCRSKKGAGTHDVKSGKNIANSHAYSIMEAEEYKGIRLLKIRNPWGAVEWTGDYSDNSPLWTPELRQAFGFVNEVKDDGVFCMTFEDFCSEFTNVVVCYC